MHASIGSIESVTCLAELFSIICYRKVVASGEFVVYPYMYRRSNVWSSQLFLSIDSVNVRLSIMLWCYRRLVCEYWLYIIGFQYIVLLGQAPWCVILLQKRVDYISHNKTPIFFIKAYFIWWKFSALWTFSWTGSRWYIFYTALWAVHNIVKIIFWLVIMRTCASSYLST